MISMKAELLTGTLHKASHQQTAILHTSLNASWASTARRSGELMPMAVNTHGPQGAGDEQRRDLHDTRDSQSSVHQVNVCLDQNGMRAQKALTVGEGMANGAPSR